MESNSNFKVDQTPVPAPGMLVTTDANGMIGAIGVPVMLPPDGPDERGFIPRSRSRARPLCLPTDVVVMAQMWNYVGNDGEFTEVSASYYSLRDDARFGGWQTYLQRSNDFIRCCCHRQISKMLMSHAGGGESRVVWRWSDVR